MPVDRIITNISVPIYCLKNNFIKININEFNTNATETEKNMANLVLRFKIFFESIASSTSALLVSINTEILAEKIEMPLLIELTTLYFATFSNVEIKPKILESTHIKKPIELTNNEVAKPFMKYNLITSKSMRTLLTIRHIWCLLKKTIGKVSQIYVNAYALTIPAAPPS